MARLIGSLHHWDYACQHISLNIEALPSSPVSPCASACRATIREDFRAERIKRRKRKRKTDDNVRSALPVRRQRNNKLYCLRSAARMVRLLWYDDQTEALLPASSRPNGAYGYTRKAKKRKKRKRKKEGNTQSYLRTVFSNLDFCKNRRAKNLMLVWMTAIL